MFRTQFHLVSICLLIFVATAGAAENITKEPAPDWVERIEQVASKDSGRGDGSVRYLSSDFQWHIEKQTTYHSFATKILTAAGAEEFSQLSVGFQPAYQRLVWHSLVVERDGVPQDRLPLVNFEVIRRETGLDVQLYDGLLTAHTILKDIRPGDTIRYSYSIIGTNPIFKGHVHSFSNLVYGVGVDRIYHSVIWNPAQRKLRWKVEGGELQVEERQLGDGLRKLTYDRKNVEKWEVEQNTPDWHSNYPYLEVSDYESWADFGEWALPLYEKEGDLPPELKAVCDAIASKGVAKDQQILEVLRWVQTNIRYLGSFFGEHTHEPYALTEIVDRRYGDCKDKGITTVAMLRYLGFDAAPVLVNTYRLKAIRNDLPGHASFDHLMVHLRFDGEDYWMDPTYVFQGGNLKQQYTYDYGFAFMIREGQNDFSAVKPRGNDVKKTVLTERFDISDMNGPSELRVTTVATGADADTLRRNFASSSMDEMEKSYRDYYTTDYPGIEIATPMEMEDDVVSNRITIREHYRISGLWKNSGKPQASLYARYFATVVSIPNESERKKAYRIGHPVNIRHLIEVKMPDAWYIDPMNVKESLPYADYHYSMRGEGALCTISHEWKSKSDHLKPVDYENFRNLMAKADANLSVVFSEPVSAFTDKQVTQSRLWLLAMVIAGLIVAGAFSFLLWCWDPPARPASYGAPQGLGGWMVLPVIGCLISPFFAVYELFIYFSSIGMGEFSLFGNYPNQIKWLICYSGSVFMQTSILVFMVFQLVLLFKLRTSFPYYFLGLSIGMIFFQGVLFTLQSLVMDVNAADDGESIKNGAQLVFRLFVWGSYMMLSQRVRATFVVNRNPKKFIKGPPPLPPQQSPPPPLPAMMG